eukprot:1159399-Pelagomonas_calceolata.AAC.7
MEVDGPAVAAAGGVQGQGVLWGHSNGSAQLSMPLSGHANGDAHGGHANGVSGSGWQAVGPGTQQGGGLQHRDGLAVDGCQGSGEHWDDCACKKRGEGEACVTAWAEVAHGLCSCAWEEGAVTRACKLDVRCQVGVKCQVDVKCYSRSSYLIQNWKAQNGVGMQGMSVEAAHVQTLERIYAQPKRLAHLIKSVCILNGTPFSITVRAAREISHAKSARDPSRSADEDGWHPGPLPMLASACPGWVCYAEKAHGDLVLPHIAAAKSPQACLARCPSAWFVGLMLFTNRDVPGCDGELSETFDGATPRGLALLLSFASALARLISTPSDLPRSCLFLLYLLPVRVTHPSSIYHCSVMPCYDKKLEASRDELTVPGPEGSQKCQVKGLPAINFLQERRAFRGPQAGARLLKAEALKHRD